ncbi:MAG: VWA domain-containing protein [Planctomycetota bacterium]|nr:MAG: VWA domain-containing protein [Planctomycetota bacterium]
MKPSILLSAAALSAALLAPLAAAQQTAAQPTAAPRVRVAQTMAPQTLAPQTGTAQSMLQRVKLALTAGPRAPSRPTPTPLGGDHHDGSHDHQPQYDPGPDAHSVDLALCLDTSGSMKGLIDSAKEKLWAIVNELSQAEPSPTLRVALLTYGNDGHDEAQGWVSLDVPLTTDLDLISQHLFALSTNGGTEYVGRVVSTAVEQLRWSGASDAAHIVVVAGNETADQDPVRRYHEVARMARERGFHLNAIYCDNGERGVASTWEDVALLGSGYYAVIDQDHGTLAIDTPYDGKLTLLNDQLNRTYIAFGSAGAAGLSNQVAQDSNSRSVNRASLADRVATKGGKLYKCAWDLVDACDSGDIDLETVAPEDLPEELAGLSLVEREAFVAGKRADRARVQAQIAQVHVQRQAFQAQVRAERSLEDDDAFDRVLRDAVRAQLTAKGFSFPQPPAPACESEPAPQCESPSEREPDGC